MDVVLSNINLIISIKSNIFYQSTRHLCQNYKHSVLADSANVTTKRSKYLKLFFTVIERKSLPENPIDLQKPNSVEKMFTK